MKCRGPNGSFYSTSVWKKKFDTQEHHLPLPLPPPLLILPFSSPPSPSSPIPTRTTIQNLHNTSPLLKPRAKHPIRILEHTILKTHNNKLGSSKAGFDQAANILGMREVERGVDFVENVHGGGWVLKQGEDEGEGD